MIYPATAVIMYLHLGKATKNDKYIKEAIKYLETQGYKYVFIDEVTLMEDFIEGAALKDLA